MIKCSIYNGISFIKLQWREEKKIEINSTFGYIELVDNEVDCILQICTILCPLFK